MIEVGLTIGKLTELRDLHDARVVDDVDGARLVEKARYQLGILRQLRAEDLDRDLPLNLRVNRLKDRTHTPAADLANDAIWSDMLSGHRLHLLYRSYHFLTRSRYLRIAVARSLRTNKQFGSV